MFDSLKLIWQDHLELRSIAQHHSRLGRYLAPAYTEFLEKTRERVAVPPVNNPGLQKAAAEFEEKGFAVYWDEKVETLATEIINIIQAEEQKGDQVWDQDFRYTSEIYRKFPQVEQLFTHALGPLLETIFQTHYKIFSGTIFKSEHLKDDPEGSQLWHSDGGPGTCVNTLIYLKDTRKEHGAMECLPWKYSYEIFKGEFPVIRARLAKAVERNPDLTRMEQRAIKCGFFEEKIKQEYADKVVQPVGRAGTILAFRNNILHRGGFPLNGHSRYACSFHSYPSDKPANLAKYKELGISKKGPYPKDPAQDF
ncbi:MAG: hypothetical protein SGI71_08435 [Verrucomicrobiota bacterium]|nr:hypothetical protein [Verrucomicrobiota bacterium]